MKVSEGLRKAFSRLEGGKKWWHLDQGRGDISCRCAATACDTGPSVSLHGWSGSVEVKYLYKALPQWAREKKRTKIWENVADYNDDPRCEFKHISALYGKAIKLAEIDEAESAGLVGKARLLRVALALREVRNPRFDMSTYVHICGTPACAMGHYAARTDLQDAFILERLSGRGFQLMKADGSDDRSDDHMKHFHITGDEWCDLFSMRGCGRAKTAIETADYIEKFAHTKWETP